jgi:hypothetical protein
MSRQAEGLVLPGGVLGRNGLGLCMAERALVAAFRGGEDNSWQALARGTRVAMGDKKPIGGARAALSARQFVDWVLDVARKAPAAPGTGDTRTVRGSGPIHFMTKQVGAY